LEFVVHVGFHLMVQVVCLSLPFIATTLFHHLWDEEEGLLMVHWRGLSLMNREGVMVD
jgi:hypothetical protein